MTGRSIHAHTTLQTACRGLCNLAHLYPVFQHLRYPRCNRFPNKRKNAAVAIAASGYTAARFLSGAPNQRTIGPTTKPGDGVYNGVLIPKFTLTSNGIIRMSCSQTNPLFSALYSFATTQCNTPLSPRKMAARGSAHVTSRFCRVIRAKHRLVQCHEMSQPPLAHGKIRRIPDYCDADPLPDLIVSLTNRRSTSTVRTGALQSNTIQAIHTCERSMLNVSQSIM